MRLKQYLKEEVTLEDIKTLILKDVERSYLEALKSTGSLIFRGADMKTSDIDKVVPRKDRIPSSTPMIIHTGLDKIFKHRFGWNVRSEGVFTTGKVTTAMFYGNECSFFPIGKYKFVYSPDICDLFGDCVYMFARNNGKSDKSAGKYFKENPKMVDIFLKDFDKKIIKGYRDTDLIGAIKSRNEIVFKCGSYYLVHSKFENDLKEWIKNET